MQLYNDTEFLEYFRVSRRIAVGISEQYLWSVYFTCQSGGNSTLSSLQQTHNFLWYAGHQTASFTDVADGFNISIGVLHTIIKSFVTF